MVEIPTTKQVKATESSWFPAGDGACGLRLVWTITPTYFPPIKQTNLAGESGETLEAQRDAGLGSMSARATAARTRIKRKARCYNGNISSTAGNEAFRPFVNNLKSFTTSMLCSVSLATYLPLSPRVIGRTIGQWL